VRCDPHAAAMLDFLAGCYDGSFSYVRDDGHVSGMNIRRRFAGFPDYAPVERDACQLASGTLLDVGCGSGKHLLGLRDRRLGGARVRYSAGVDNSSVVMAVLRQRGVTGVCQMDTFRLGFSPGTFDTITLFANGLSIGGSVAGVRRLLAEFGRVTAAAGQVLVTNVDVQRSPHDHDRRYHQANLAAGRPPGQLTLRCRYRGIDGAPFPWLLLGPAELAMVAAGTGWQVGLVRSQPDGGYCARLVKGR
jgi:SAM-dependent methyltransferase